MEKDSSTSRRAFLKNTTLLGVGVLMNGCQTKVETELTSSIITAPSSPVLIATWNKGLRANEAAWNVLGAGGRAIDAVEQGVRAVEADENDKTVGVGGRPDRDGKVTLDAAIMDESFNCGSVGFVQGIKHPVSLARMVMEKTPHVFLVGQGAEKFALENGFKKENLLTQSSQNDWEKWRQEILYEPVVNVENHDTVGILALDQLGNLSAATSTSGLAYKYHGRIGDSPIIGSGLYVDNQVGAATATGTGEEFMRNGLSPYEACKKVVERTLEIFKMNDKNPKDHQVAFIAINKEGEVGAYVLQSGFTFAVHHDEGNSLNNAAFVFERG